MKTQKFVTTIVGGVVIGLVQAIAFNAAAQATRQESSNQLKKVVYAFDPSSLPQMMMPKTDLFKLCNVDLYGSYRYYALVNVPEITVSNMPSVEFWWNNSGAGAPPSFWTPVPTLSVAVNFDYGPLLCFVTNGLCGLLWKVEFHPPGFPDVGWETNNHCPELQGD